MDYAFKELIENPPKDFKCYMDDPTHHPHYVGDCKHRERPVDGVWKMAPRHLMLEDCQFFISVSKYTAIRGTYGSP